LINKLEESKYKLPLRKALASYGTNHLILYKDRFFDNQLSKKIRKSIPGIFSHIPNQDSVDHLFEMIGIEDTDLRYHVIKTLNKILRERPSLQMDESRIRKVLTHETKSFFELLAIKQIQPPHKPNKLLLKALNEKQDQTKERIFRLLGLIYDPRDMYGTYLALKSVSSQKQSAAIEFLDNVLSDEDKKYIFPIVDKQNDLEKLEAARQLFDIPELRYDKALMQLIEGEDLWLQACAIYSVSAQCPVHLQNEVKKATHSSNELIKETAEMVLKRNSKTY
jgi:HEAT repeat protein